MSRLVDHLLVLLHLHHDPVQPHDRVDRLQRPRLPHTRLLQYRIGHLRGAGKRGPQPKIAQQLQRIQSLPAAKQKAIAQVLESVIAAHQ